MAINKEVNTRVNITIQKTLYKKIQILAKDDMRSANSLMVLLIHQALRDEKWQERIKELGIEE